MPESFEPEEIGRFGNLTLVMPPPEVIAAAKLVRGDPVDIEDVVWWVKQRGLDAGDIQVVIDKLPHAATGISPTGTSFSFNLSWAGTGREQERPNALY